MADTKRQKLAFIGSTSFRLAIGFGAVLCMFCAALLIDLYHLGQVKNATEEARVRQQIRGETRKIAEICEALYALQRDFVVADGLDEEKIEQFKIAYETMKQDLQALYSLSLDQRERGYVSKLTGRARRLSDTFFDKVVKTKQRVHEGSATEEELRHVHQASRAMLDEIREFNASLGRLFDTKIHHAEYEAELAWQLSVSVAKATLAVALVASLLVIYLTHRAIVRPISGLVEGTKSLAGGDLGRRIEVPASGEFRELAESFNRMTEALASNQKQLIEAEKMATVGRFAAGTAHEINNPIAVILGYAKTMTQRLPPHAPELEGLKAIEEEAQQCKKIVQGLLDLSRPADEEAGEVINPNEVVSEVIGMARSLQLTEQVTIKTSVIDEPVPLTLSRSRLRQVILNIASNALEALQGVSGGELRIEGYLTDSPEHGTPRTRPLAESGDDRQPGGRAFLLLRFTDNGPGVPEENLGRLFEPFFTTKGHGTGLGLAITYSIINAHAGRIDVASSEGKGATFTVSLPLQEES